MLKAYYLIMNTAAGVPSFKYTIERKRVGESVFGDSIKLRGYDRCIVVVSVICFSVSFVKNLL